MPIKNSPSSTDPFIDEWLEESPDENISVYTERDGARQRLLKKIIRTVTDHFSNIEKIDKQIERLGFKKSLACLRNKIPQDIRTRSGDLGEVLCTEFIVQKTDFRVPIKKLRWKDDRDRTMRGNDVLGFRTINNIRQVMKAESKSRTSLSNTVIQEAEAGLMQHGVRPNPSSLAFLQNRLEDEGRIEEADWIASLQEKDFSIQNLQHLIFTLSGNPPHNYLATKRSSEENQPARMLIGFHITDHKLFIKTIYEECINGSFRTNS